jgi:PHD/YefM family antitoxin component YafN of YafNO toxin-antitoxin module
MKLSHRAVLVLALGTLLMGIPGCMENIALFPRPSLPEAEPDVVGSVERVDLDERRLYLRPQGGGRRVVLYSRDAQVFYRGREYPVTRLVPGDVVEMQMKRDTRGELYVDSIRIQEENVSGRVRRDDFTTAPRIERLAGTVESINRRDVSFELNNRPGQIVLVALSEYVRDSDRERFRTLRSGDHVRIEGKYVSRDRFEMLSFLNDEY